METASLMEPDCLKHCVVTYIIKLFRAIYPLENTGTYELNINVRKLIVELLVARSPVHKWPHVFCYTGLYRLTSLIINISYPKSF